MTYIIVIGPCSDQTFPPEPASAVVSPARVVGPLGFPSVVLRAVEDTGAVLITDLASREKPALPCFAPTETCKKVVNPARKSDPPVSPQLSCEQLKKR